METRKKVVTLFLIIVLFLAVVALVPNNADAQPSPVAHMVERNAASGDFMAEPTATPTIILDCGGCSGGGVGPG